MIKTSLKAIYLSLSFTIGILLFYVTIKIYSVPIFSKVENDVVNVSVLQQLNYLNAALKNGAADQMQKIYPEGYFFTHVLYGLSWCDFLAPVSHQSKLYKEGISEITATLQQLELPQSKTIFNPNLPLQYGAFYVGWSNYLLAKKLQLQLPPERDTLDIQLFKTNCQQLFNAYQKQAIPYLESYEYAIWPADNMLCLASLSLHDQLFTPQYQTFLQNKIQQIVKHLDNNTQLIAHSVLPDDGSVKEGPRGSSQSLMLCLLPSIDSALAKHQFKRYKECFLSNRFGLMGIREYPKGVYGSGDIDSGPVILGIGGAASIVGTRAMAANNDWQLYGLMRQNIEALGFPIIKNGQKYYLNGAITVADAFIVWVNAINNQPSKTKKVSFRWQFHLFQLLIGLILLIAWRWIRFVQ